MLCVRIWASARRFEGTQIARRTMAGARRRRTRAGGSTTRTFQSAPRRTCAARRPSAFPRRSSKRAGSHDAGGVVDLVEPQREREDGDDADDDPLYPSADRDRLVVALSARAGLASWTRASRGCAVRLPQAALLGCIWSRRLVHKWVRVELPSHASERQRQTPPRCPSSGDLRVPRSPCTLQRSPLLPAALAQIQRLDSSTQSPLSRSSATAPPRATSRWHFLGTTARIPSHSRVANGRSANGSSPWKRRTGRAWD